MGDDMFAKQRENTFQVNPAIGIIVEEENEIREHFKAILQMDFTIKMFKAKEIRAEI